jgi:hypothetical protein
MLDIKSLLQSSKTLLKERKNIFYALGFLIAITSIVIVLFVFVFNDKLAVAFKSKDYEKTVQVKLLMKSDSLESEPEDQNSQSTEAPPSSEDEKMVMKKDGDIFFEEGQNNKIYYYYKNSEFYVTYFDDMLGLKKGKWVEIKQKDFGRLPLFDFNILKKLSSKDFIFKDGAYTPKASKLNEIFYLIFGIGKINQEKYFIYDLNISIKNKRIEKITANYIYDEKISSIQTLLFTYDNIKLSVPSAEETK